MSSTEAWKDVEGFNAFASRMLSDATAVAASKEVGVELKEIRRQFDLYREEGTYAIGWLGHLDLKGRRILEVGAGIGIFSAWLLHCGLDQYALEPGRIGFDTNLSVLNALWRRYGFSLDRVLDTRAEDLSPDVHGRYDILFSMSVFEHIENLGAALTAVTSVMKDDGLQIHFTPNYSVPYEPHFMIFHIPPFPKLMGKLAGVSDVPMWKSLNFITYGDVCRFAKCNGLEVGFATGTMLTAFKRLEYDPVYRGRHRKLYIVWQALKRIRIPAVIERIPARLSTPMVFTLYRSPGERRS